MTVSTWGDYEVYFDRVLGNGGMGAVYLGRQISLDRPVAIKVLKKELVQSGEFVQRFHREAALLARLVDSHVVQVYGAGEGEGRHFYAMEYVEGEDLAARLRRGQKFSVDEILNIAHRVAKALEAATHHRIVHRDIKPSNIVITKDNHIKVMDFGLAKSPDSELTQPEMIMGTAKYISPEQADGRPCDARSDLYSLGAVLYELAAGRPPFEADNITGLLYQHVHRKPDPPRKYNPELPKELEALILRLLAKPPEERYQTPEAFILAIKNLMDGVTSEDKTSLFGEIDSSTVTEAAPARSGRGAFYTTLVLAVAALAGGGYFLLRELGSTPPGPTGNVAASATQTDPPPVEPRKSDPDEKTLRARANESIAKGDAETDDEKALEHYEQAKKSVDDEEVRRKIARASFRLWSKSAEKQEGIDWGQAAADWTRALAVADEERKGDIDAHRKFCSLYADAVRARSGRQWGRALELLKELAKEPKAYASRIAEEMKEVESELARSTEVEDDKVKQEFAAILDQGRASFRKAAWAESLANFERALDPKFSNSPREELGNYLRDVRAALAAPKGMVYVVSGKFRMGGGRDLESPEGEVETRAFYIDEREVTAAEYLEFLSAIGTSGHHSGCHRDEPKGEMHVTGDLTAQKPESPVVSVNWWDAFSYAAWRKKRLPTEAEWEKAAGYDMSAKRLYPWGNQYAPEGGKSFFGCDGMGNGILEWTADWFQKYSWSEATHPDFGEKKKVLRGGVLLAEDAAQDARVTHRFWYGPSYRSKKAGFRCVQDISER